MTQMNLETSNRKKHFFRSPLFVRGTSDLWMGIIFFGLMVWLAWDFYLERICYQDSASYILEMIRKEWFMTVHSRFGAIFSQIIPLILLKFKAPLKVVLIGYSINFVILYAACFWFARSVCQHRAAAYTICFLLVFSVKSTFFWPVTELLQGVIFSAVFFAWWNSKRHRNAYLHYIVAFLICLLALMTHPLTCAVLELVVFYDFLDQSERPIKQRLLRLGIGIVPALFILKGFSSPYEQAQVPSLDQARKLLAIFEELPGTSRLFELLAEEFSVLFLALGLLVLILAFKKKWLKLCLALAFNLAFFVLIAITYPYGATVLAYENTFYPMVMCQTLLISHELLIPYSRFKLPQISLFILTLLFLFNIYGHSRVYQTKTEHFQAIANSLEGSTERKIVFSSFNYPHQISMMSWPSSAESLLFSSLEGPDKSFTFYIAQEDEYDLIRGIQPADELLLEYPWSLKGSQYRLPKHYFNLPAKPYSFVNGSNELSGDSVLTLLSHTKMKWVNRCSDFRASTKPYFRLRFENSAADPIPSTRMSDNSVFIAYRFFFNGELVDWQPPKTTLLMDIRSQMEQLVLVEIPEQKEDIEIQFGLVGYNGYKMYLTSPKYPIRIR